MTDLLLLALALLLIAACGVFVAAEFAFVTVDRAQVDRDALAGDHAAQGVQSALRSLSTQLSGAQVGHHGDQPRDRLPRRAGGLAPDPRPARVRRGAGRRRPGGGHRHRPRAGHVPHDDLRRAGARRTWPSPSPCRPRGPRSAFMRGVHRGHAGAHPAAQRLGQRVRTPARARAPGGAALGAQLDRAGLAHLALGLRRDPRPGHRRAHGALGRVRHPDGRRDHDPARAHAVARGGRPCAAGDRARAQHRPLPVPRPRRGRHRGRDGPRQERGGPAGPRAVDHAGQAPDGQTHRGAGLPPSRPAAGAPAQGRLPARGRAGRVRRARRDRDARGRGRGDRRGHLRRARPLRVPGPQAPGRLVAALGTAAARRGRGPHRRTAPGVRGLRHRRGAGPPGARPDPRAWRHRRGAGPGRLRRRGVPRAAGHPDRRAHGRAAHRPGRAQPARRTGPAEGEAER